MRGCATALAILLLGCGPAPSEVAPVYEGQTSATGDETSVGASSDRGTTGSTGPVADGSAGSGSDAPEITIGSTATGEPVDPSTAGTTGDPPGGSSGPVTGDPPGGSSGDPPPPDPATCDEIFGTAAGYVLCTEADDSCAFNVTTQGNSCTAICQSFGRECIGALDNPGAGDPQPCLGEGALPCDNASKSTTICICTR